MDLTKVKTKRQADPTIELNEGNKRVKRHEERIEENSRETEPDQIRESAVEKPSVETQTTQPGSSETQDIDYQKMYFALLAEHNNLKKEHEALKTVMFGENGKFRFLEVNVNLENENQESTN